MARKTSKSYWAVIPGHVLYDKDLSPSAKLLYGVVSALCSGEEKTLGYCYAENATLAAWFGVSERQISRMVTLLEEKGYIRTEMAPVAKGSERRIYAGIYPDMRGRQKCPDHPGGVDKNVHSGPDKKVQTHIRNDSNTVITPLNPPKGGKRGRKEEPPPDWRPELFERFWRYYPHDYRGNKQQARRAWNKLQPAKETLTALAYALERHKKSKRWEEGIGIPNASTFINPANGYWDLTDAERAEGTSQDGPGAGDDGRLREWT